VSPLRTELSLNYKEVEEEILRFIRKVVSDAGAKGAVIGLSGGIDSAVVGALCVRALGKDKVIGILMPAGHTPTQDTRDGKKMAETWGIKFYEVGIDPIFEAFLGAMPTFKGENKIAKANVKARIRMVINYFVANSHNMLVAGTGDKSEDLIGFFCYDEKTRVVTKEGPKSYDELREGDTVFSYDRGSNLVVESTVGAVHVFDHDGAMVHFISDNLDLMVTPNHRILVRSSSNGELGYTKVEFRTAEECLERKYTVIPVPQGWNGKPGVPTKLTLEFSQRHVKKTIEVAVEDALYLLGLFIGDGSATRGKVVVPVVSNLSRREFAAAPRDSRGHFLQVSSERREARMKTYDTYETDFALPMSSKEGARGRLVQILERYGIGYSLTQNLVRVPSKEIYEFFLQCGYGAKSKRIPDWALEYPAHQLSFLLQGLKDSDGNHSNPSQVYYTSSSLLKDDFVELCTKVGRFPTVRIRPARVNHYKGKSIKSSAQYEISYSAKGKNSRWVTNSRAKSIHHVGKVWCPSVPPHENILVERNGRYVFCGNTKYGDGGVDFLPIAHLYKTQVRELGAHLGLPKSVVTKPSSPQLWPGHKAVDEIPIAYETMDPVLVALFDEKLPAKEAAKKTGVDIKVVQDIMRRHRASAHKRGYPPMLGSW
jgi:NH3-dependent NAD+ synthetase